jgi:aspartate-semialdehyde dehydrogenase
MVGSVLLDRMQSEEDFAHIEPTFFSTSNAGATHPHWVRQAANRSSWMPPILPRWVEWMWF